MPKFNQGDVVVLPGRDGQWTIGTWPLDDVGSFVCYQDGADGIRAWTTAVSGIAHPENVYDAEGNLVHSKGERVDELVTPLLVRRGTPPPNLLIASEALLAELGLDREDPEWGALEVPVEQQVEEITGIDTMTVEQLRERLAQMERQGLVLPRPGDTVEVTLRGTAVEVNRHTGEFAIRSGPNEHSLMKYNINPAHENVVNVEVLAHPWAVGDILTVDTDLAGLPVGTLATDGVRHLLWCQDGTWRGTADSVTTVLPSKLTIVFVPAAS